MKIEYDWTYGVIDGHESLWIHAIEMGPKVVGGAVVCGWTRVFNPSTEPVLVDLFVHERLRRRGIGTNLVGIAVRECCAAEKPLGLYYLPDSPTRGLVAAMGFVEDGRTGVEGGDERFIWASVPRGA